MKRVPSKFRLLSDGAAFISINSFLPLTDSFRLKDLVAKFANLLEPFFPTTFGEFASLLS